MKKTLTLLISISLLMGCKKEMPEPPTEHSGGNTFGMPTFSEYYITFFNNNFAGSPLSVNINGYLGNITYAYNYNPGCGAVGCANFTLPPGNYSYGYQSNSGNYVVGTIKTGAVQCITILIN
ncbi:MAG: hypothetical protein JNL69_04100 [Bacteroidia bacterium]|nr:hypothetical protein [Bacteroidia bacterium]